MTIIELTEWFKWMAIINVGLFFLSFIAIALFKSFVLKIQSLIFSVPEDRLLEKLYSLFGIYKIVIIVLCIVPYIALLVIQ